MEGATASASMASEASATAAPARGAAPVRGGSTTILAAAARARAAADAGESATGEAPATATAGAAVAEPTLGEVCALAIDCRLATPDRRGLLIHEPALLASIPRKDRDADQLRADLLALTRLPTPGGGRPALARWFTTAAEITAQDHNPATEQFTRWAALAERSAAFASESWRPRRRWPVVAGVGGALVAVAIGVAVTVDRPLVWPGPVPVVVELPGGSLRVDRDEVAVADLGDCHLPEPPADQRGWCAALGEVIAGDGIGEGVIAGAGRRSVVGVSPAVAERICAMRGMRLPWDDEFTALLALGQPAWPADEAGLATLALRDVRGAQAIRRLATGAAEFVRVEGGYRVRGVPMVSAAAMRVAEMAPSKALHEVASPPLGEAVAGTDTGFRCVGDVE